MLGAQVVRLCGRDYLRTSQDAVHLFLRSPAIGRNQKEESMSRRAGRDCWPVTQTCLLVYSLWRIWLVPCVYLPLPASHTLAYLGLLYSTLGLSVLRSRWPASDSDEHLELPYGQARAMRMAG